MTVDPMLLGWSILSFACEVTGIALATIEWRRRSSDIRIHVRSAKASAVPSRPRVFVGLQKDASSEEIEAWVKGIVADADAAASARLEAAVARLTQAMGDEVASSHAQLRHRLDLTAEEERRRRDREREALSFVILGTVLGACVNIAGAAGWSGV